jgi:prepilin peptidase CpaA
VRNLVDTAGIEQFGPLALLAAIALTGAVYDLRFRRIPNWLCGLALAAGIALAFLVSAESPGSHALHVLIVLAAGLVFFALKMLGGGDVKFYAGLASFFPLAKATALLLYISISGIVLVAIWFVSRRLAGIPMRGRSGGKSDELPYGIAIGAGAILANVL